MIEVLKKLQKWIEPWSSGTSPMEIRRAILDDIVTKAVSIGGGKKIFPFDCLRIHVLAADQDQRTVLERVIHQGWNLQPSILHVLSDSGCPAPSNLAIECKVEAEADPRFGERRFFVEYELEEAPETPSARPSLELQVTRGQALKEHLVTSQSRIYVGRLREVFDRHRHLERRNDLAFGDDGEINATVSRKHASIHYDEKNRSYWLRDDNSAAGTRIFRDGRAIRVGSHRQGVRLRDGDEISFGQAQVTVGLKGP